MDALTAKLKEISDVLGTENASEAYAVLANDMVPFLQQDMVPIEQHVAVWDSSIRVFLSADLPLTSMFPVYDLLRLAVTRVAACEQTVEYALERANSVLPTGDARTSRSLWLTALRLAGNGLARHLPVNVTVAALLCEGILSADASVRTAAATGIYNASLKLQHVRQDRIELVAKGVPRVDARTSDVEVQFVCACIETLSRENNYDIAFRIAAALLQFIYRAPSWAEQLRPLFDVLDAEYVLQEAGKRNEAISSESHALTRVLADARLLSAT